MAGQSMRDIKRRINSIKNTQQITRAMEIVAATKLRRAQQNVLAARPFARKLQEVLGRLVEAQRAAAAAGRGRKGRRGADVHPLLQVRPVERVAYVLITADRGLAGGYNANVIRLAENILRAEERAVTTVAVGRKGRDFLQRGGWPMLEEYTRIGDEVNLDFTRRLSAMLTSRFEQGDVDEVHLIYNMFVSAVVQRPVSVRLLPITGLEGEGEGDTPAAEGAAPAAEGAAAAADGGEEEGQEYIYEPSPEAVLGILLPRYVDTQVYQALLEAKAAEHAARMTAMRNATDNAAEMIRQLNLSFNRARQESITKEISEIVGGAEALVAAQ